MDVFFLIIVYERYLWNKLVCNTCDNDTDNPLQNSTSPDVTKQQQQQQQQQEHMQAIHQQLVIQQQLVQQQMLMR